MKETAAEWREKILDTAVALFIERGLENVKTRELTTQLGISRSHIYHYFPDWATLSLEACTWFARNDLHTFSQQIAQLPCAQRLDAFIDSALPQEPDAVWQLYSSLWRKATMEKAYAELATSVTAGWQHLMTAIIQEGITSGEFCAANAEQVARQLNAMLNGYADLLIVVQDTGAREQAIADLKAFIALAL